MRGHTLISGHDSTQTVYPGQSESIQVSSVRALNLLALTLGAWLEIQAAAYYGLRCILRPLLRTTQCITRYSSQEAGLLLRCSRDRGDETGQTSTSQSKTNNGAPQKLPIQRAQKLPIQLRAGQFINRPGPDLATTLWGPTMDDRYSSESSRCTKTPQTRHLETNINVE